MKTLALRFENNVLTIKLNRPDVHNAFNPEMIEELTTAFKVDARKSGVRAILLTAEGKSFSSGADLSYMKSMVNYSIEENVRDADRLFEMFDSARTCPVPIVGKIFGYVMGGGLGLVSVCDIVGAHRETQFAFTEARLGLVPSVISGFILEKIPRHLAQELMLTAETFEAGRALQTGLVHFIGETEEVDDFVQSKIDFILGNGPEAVQATKALLRFVKENNWPAIRKETTRVIAERRASAEGQEGLTSFFDKRKPSWKRT